MTPLGKEFRKWRIDHDLLLGDMADKLGISSSYLSQIEKGNKAIPPDFAERAARILNVDRDRTQVWKRAAVQSTSEFTVKASTARDREVAHRFATEFARLTPAQKDNIQRLLGG